MSLRKKALKFLKWIAIILGAFIILLVAACLISPKYIVDYIEDHDREWINRDITIQKFSINPLLFTITINGVKVTEPDANSTFVSFDRLFINLDSWPLLKSQISTQEITVENLFGNIVQNGSHFNFSDLLDSDSDSDSNTESQEETSFTLKNINIINSSIQYSDQVIGSTLLLDSIAIHDESFSGNDTFWDADIEIHQPDGGWIRGNTVYNLKNSDYKINTAIDNWQLSPFKNYVTSVIQLSQFEGRLDTHLSISGNTGKSDYFKSNGDIKVSDLKIVDPESKPLVTMETFRLDIDSINTQSNLYDFNKILVDNLHIKYEYLPNGDNFTKWLVQNDSTQVATSSTQKNTSEYYVSPFEMLSVYIYDMTRDYIFKSYSADSISVRNFNLKFHDYTLEDPFYMDITKLDVLSLNIKPENKHAYFDINGIINSTGKLKGDITVSREGIENMDVDLSIKGLFLNRFSPYGRYYTAHPFMEGITTYTTKSSIKDSYLKSTNNIFVEKIKVGKKRKTNSGYSLPMKLVVALIRDLDGNVSLEIPIEGPINDPKYKFGKVIWKVIKNIFVKLATSPFRALSNALSLNEDDLENLYFDSGQIGLGKPQLKSLNSIANVLSKKPEFVIELNHLYNIEYEMDALAIHTAKLNYLKQSEIPLSDKIPIRKQAHDIPTTDPEFLTYVKNNTTNFDPTISIPENVRRLLGEEKIALDLQQVIAKQKELVSNYLTQEKGIDISRFTINDISKEEISVNQTRPKFEVLFKLDENATQLPDSE
ncbi:DUF748 domain-containing protein [Aquimarina pacifica]|uniref:DUF748 domain-containing protein n=1 Tax=Aquimarina pacifica TaxID=1296415 RepID=UPI000470CF34|nr:DUF748 domain-containing protein [Aquimarina pacifica]